jgi:hypothetical protein
MANKDSDPPAAALFSSKQREWLASGGEEPDTDAHRSLRNRIRKRLRQSFADFSLLKNLPDEDLEKVFQAPTTDQINGMTAALSIIYRGTREGVQVAGAEFESAEESFEPILRRAIRNSEASLDEPDTNPMLFSVIFDHDTIIVKKNVPAD